MTLTTRQHVLFDLDGTLVDTRAAVMGSYTRVFREKLDSPFPPQGFPAANLFAMRPAEVFASVAPGRIEELHAAYCEAYPVCAHLVKVFDGIRDMVLGLVAQGRRVSLVTNKGIERTLIDLDVAQIPPQTFSTIVTAEDTIERKPHPAPILLGLSRLGANPNDGVYVGDGPHDIEAARAAGLSAVAVTYGFYARKDLVPYAPDSIADNVAELCAVLGVAKVSMVQP